MLLTLAHIGVGKAAPSKAARQSAASLKTHYESLTRIYIDRIVAYSPCAVEAFATEATFLAWVQKQAGRVPATLILLDSSGPQLSSIAFSQWLGKQRDQGAQHLIFAIGPHDGWSATALALTQGQNLLLSFGPITLPHELARLVLAEQLYRACTILQGHPYHSGH